MELQEIVEVARNFAVMVRIQGPDPEGLKMRRYSFYHHKFGMTSISGSGLLLPDSIASGLLLPDYLQQHSHVSALVVTTASILEPFLEHDQNNPSQVLSRLIPGALIDVLAERNNRAGEKLNESDDKTPHWLSAKLLALVDVPASSLALQSLLADYAGSPEHGSWEVGWYLDPLTDDLQTKDEKDDQSSVESRRCSALKLVAMSATRIAFLGVPELNSQDFPNISVSQPNKRGDLLVVMGSPIGFQSPLHFLNSISVGAVSNCCPPGSHESSLLISDTQCLPGMEGGPVFGKHARLIGILTRPIRRKDNGIEIQLVVTWDALSTALRIRGNQYGYDLKKAGSHDKTDFHGSFDYTPELPKTQCSPPFSFETALPSIVLVRVGDGAGASGIVLNNQGLILTNAHLLEPFRFWNKRQISGTEVTTFLALSTLSVCEQERSDGQKGRQWSSPSLVKTMDSSVGDDHMASKSAFIEKQYETLHLLLDHTGPRVWHKARAVYVSKGSLDVALLQLLSVPNQFCPIFPHFVCPSPGSKAFFIGRGLFGPWSGLYPSVYSGVVRVVETAYGSGGPAMLETTAAVHPGASGSAMIKSDGHMIGLVTGSLVITPYINFSVPCAALKPIFDSSRGMGDLSTLQQAMDKQNEFLTSVWGLGLKQQPSSQRPEPFPYLPKSLMEKINEGKGSRFVKSLAEKRAETSPGKPPPSMDQPIKEEFLAKILPCKL